jgi:hypothetical protein
MASSCVVLVILKGTQDRIPIPCVVGSNPTGGAHSFGLVTLLFTAKDQERDGACGVLGCRLLGPFLAGVVDVCADRGYGMTIVPITGAADDVLRVTARRRRRVHRVDHQQ